MNGLLTKKVYLPLALTLSAIATSVSAEPVSVDWSLGVQPELELTSRLSDRLDLRFGVNGDFRDESVGLFDNPVVFSALVDWSFSDNGFRLTGGALVGDQLQFDSDFNVGPSDAYATRTYVGLGWGNQLDSENRLGISLDLGLTFEALEDPNGGTGRTFSGPSDRVFGQNFDTLQYEPNFSASLEYRF